MTVQYNMPGLEARRIVPAMAEAFRNYFDEGGTRDDDVRLHIVVRADDKGDLKADCHDVVDLDNTDLRAASIMRQDGVTIKEAARVLRSTSWSNDIRHTILKCVRVIEDADASVTLQVQNVSDGAVRGEGSFDLRIRNYRIEQQDKAA